MYAYSYLLSFHQQKAQVCTYTYAYMCIHIHHSFFCVFSEFSLYESLYVTCAACILQFMLFSSSHTHSLSLPLSLCFCIHFCVCQACIKIHACSCICCSYAFVSTYIQTYIHIIHTFMPQDQVTFEIVTGAEAETGGLMDNYNLAVSASIHV
jgi:hypothetical protein